MFLAGLEDSQGRGVAADVRKVDESRAAESGTDGGVHGLQLGTGGNCYFDCAGNASHFEHDINRQLKANLYCLARNYGGSEPCFGDRDGVGAWVYVGEHVKPLSFRCGGPGSAGCSVVQVDNGSSYNGARAIRLRFQRPCPCSLGRKPSAKRGRSARTSNKAQPPLAYLTFNYLLDGLSQP